jgi:hypothetical protein
MGKNQLILAILEVILRVSDKITLISDGNIPGQNCCYNRRIFL